MCSEAREKRFVAGVRRSRLVQHDQVEPRQVMPMSPERFANYPFQTISPCCKFAVLFADGKSQSGIGGVVGPVKDCKQLVATSPCVPEDTTVGVLVGQAAAAPETVIGYVAFRCAAFRDGQYLYVLVTVSAWRGLWHGDA